MKSVSVVIPVYNEQKDIRDALMDVIKVLPDAEIILVNDCSTDDTLLELQRFVLETEGKVNLRVLMNEKNLGHGRSVVRGLKEATKDYILYIDADRQIELNFDEIPDDFDFVSGWRIHRYDKPFRKVISFCLKMTNLLYHRMYIKDANCPFKIYKKTSLISLLDELPKTYIVPIACLEVLARKHKLDTYTIKTPHLPYNGIREGFLQLPDKKFFQFCWKAFKEVTSL